MQHFTNFELKNYTSFKIGGKAQNVYFPENTAEFIELLEKLENPLVLGGMSNVLISSLGIEQDVILTKKLNHYEVNNDEIYAQAGVMGPILSRIATEKSLSGMEFMCGFPGTIGGIVAMNAGAHKQCISDIFLEANVFDKNSKKIYTFTKEDMSFDYRKSIILDKNFIILDAKFKLISKEQSQIISRVNENQNFRKEKQPNLSTPNCGSVFRNPTNESAGRLLEEVGAKDFIVGGAKVYEKHANFIINFDNATSTDVSKLIKKMYNEVNNKFSIKLKPEVRFIGNMNEEEKEIWNELLNN